MHKSIWSVAVAALLGASAASVLAAQAPAGATAKCKDDTYSTSASHRGACKGHGGVADWLAATSDTSKSGKSAGKTKSAAKTTTAPTETASTAAPPADATAKCKDGTFSTSASHRGACKGHGGVGEWLAEGKTKTTAPSTKTAAATTTTPPAAAATTAPASTGMAAPKTSVATTPPAGAPADATAQCKDGSYSHSKHHRGACSKHGGVQQWLKDIPE